MKASTRRPYFAETALRSLASASRLPNLCPWKGGGLRGIAEARHLTAGVAVDPSSAGPRHAGGRLRKDRRRYRAKGRAARHSLLRRWRSRIARSQKGQEVFARRPYRPRARIESRGRAQGYVS